MLQPGAAVVPAGGTLFCVGIEAITGSVSGFDFSGLNTYRCAPVLHGAAQCRQILLRSRTPLTPQACFVPLGGPRPLKACGHLSAVSDDAQQGSSVSLCASAVHLVDMLYTQCRLACA